MEHQEAIKTHAAEGYLLDDLTDEQRDAFEEHFADCETCFSDVHAGAVFTARLREIDDVPVPLPVPNRGWMQWALAASLAVAVAGPLVQQTVVVTPLRAQLAQARQPHVTTVFTIRDVRGERAVDGSKPVTLEIDLPADHRALEYTVTIADAAGKKLHSEHFTVDPAKQWVDIHVPARAFPPGEYTIQLSGADGSAAPPLTFTVR